MSRRLIQRGRSRQSTNDALGRPVSRAHLLRPLSRNQVLKGRGQYLPSSQERLDIVKGSHLTICTLKDFNRSRNELATAKQEDHSTKEQTQIMRTHFRPVRKMSDHPYKQAYRRTFLRLQQDEERWFQELCQCMGILH